MKTMLKLLLIILSLSVTACGGGDNPPANPGQSQTQNQAVIKLTLVGGPETPDTLGSLQFDLILPEGFLLDTDLQGQLAEGVLTTTMPDNSLVTFNYVPEAAQNLGQVSLGLVNVEGFLSGTSVTLRRDLAEGDLMPLGTDFMVTNLLVTDKINAVELFDYSIDVSVSQQTVTISK